MPKLNSDGNIIIFQISLVILILIILFTYNLKNSYLTTTVLNNKTEFIGVNMKGKFTSLNYERFSGITFPSDYYEESFKLIKNIGMNHVRYVFYWEAYERNPELFINELEKVASTADRLGLNIIYDNHQFHTSSWFDQRGTGFPSLLIDPTKYSYDSSNGNITNLYINNWWTNWWNDNIKGPNDEHGWILQANFLKTVVKLLDTHPSTLGYEILNEPTINVTSQWPKVGKYYRVMADQLREHTNKTIVLDMTIPIKFSDINLNMTSSNMAVIIPTNHKNLVFKISLYGLPDINKFQKRKLDLLTDVSHTANIPLYIGEWNDITREEIANSGKSNINITASDLLQNASDSFVNEFKHMDLWGWAFWNWNYVNTPPQNFNLIKVIDGKIIPTKYYEILRNSMNKYYSNSEN